MKLCYSAIGIALVCLAPAGSAGQNAPAVDPVISRIQAEGMERSQVYRLAQTLSDSIGPRLTGAPSLKAGNDWLVSQYRTWGIPARLEQFGTWKTWRRGLSHIDLIAPRVRSLEGTMLAYSPGSAQPLQGEVTILGDAADSIAFQRWLPAVKGKIVLMSAPSASCRPDMDLQQYSLPATLAAIRAERSAATAGWTARIERTGYNSRTLPAQLESAGAIGVLTSTWSGGWGVNRIFRARTERAPMFDVGCEDYGLLYRLAERSQKPVVRLSAEASWQGVAPMFNAIAEIRGSEKPNEYVMLSAHFDSWDGASGSTDNATGTVTMMEAMRILRTVYPKPKRTILVGHWSGEEFGLLGSRAFAADHPKIVSGMQALFNQDNGTGRVINISTQGLMNAGAHFTRWFSMMPPEVSAGITLQTPGRPGTGGTDHAAFICYGAPAFGLSSLDWNYGAYTWHTNRDTFDKIVIDEVKNNAVLTAMLVYLASEDSQRVGRERAILTDPRTGAVTPWPECPKAARSWEENTR
ncbi:MAG: M28 family peptidase [Gemmatimonadaceae bacterium]